MPSNGVAVLVTGGEHLAVLAAVRALREAGYAPWVAAHDPGAYAARSRDAAGVVEVPNPATDETGFVRALVAAAARIPVSVVLPGTEFGLAALSRHAHGFPPGVVLGVCPPAVVANATDKALLGDLARAAGLSVPPTLDAGLDDLARGLPFPYPAVVKPRRSELQSSDGVVRHFAVRRVDSPAELRAALAALPGARGLVQPYLHGPLGSLAGVFWNGEMVCAVQSRGDRLWPLYTGSMTYAETVPLNRRLTASIGNVLRAVGWNGLYQVDFFEQAGEFVVIDLNPRLYTSLAIATRAGMNLPGIWVDLLRGQAPRSHGSYRTGVRYRHDEDDVRTLFGMLIRGPRGAALRGFIPRRNTVHPVFSLRDPWPLLTSLSKLLRHARRRRRAAKHAPIPLGRRAREGVSED
jgi:predicted ATP-grasp superfamily ATP-dependent carboligase